MLTPQQHKLLKFIDSFQKQNGIVPSYEEMKQALGLKSKSGIAGLMHALEQKGYVRRIANRARALEVIKMVPLAHDQKNLKYSGDNVSEGGDVREILNEKGAVVEIPFYGHIAAGLPLHVFEQEGEKLEIPASLVSESHSINDYFALKIVGNSMIEAGIIDGDIVILLKSNKANSGDIVAALIDHDEVTLKRFHLMHESIILEPANKDFIPQEYAPERVKIIGRLAHLIRKYN
jgi:repressor LexA